MRPRELAGSFEYYLGLIALNESILQAVKCALVVVGLMVLLYLALDWEDISATCELFSSSSIFLVN